MVKKSVSAAVPVIPDGDLTEFDDLRENGTTVRIITGSYEHNLLCLALTRQNDNVVFTPIFHFTAHTQSIRCLAHSGRYLVSGSNDENMRLYDLQKRKEVGTLIHHDGQITCLEFYKNKWLLSGAGDGKICLWRLRDWEVLAELKGHKSPVLDLSLHSTGKVALSIAENKTLILWNLMTGKRASVKTLAEQPRRIDWIPDSQKYIIGYAKKLCTDTKTIPLESSLYYTEFLTIQNNIYYVASLENGSICFFTLESILSSDNDDEIKPEFVLSGHAVRVKGFSMLNNLLASCSTDGKIVVWDLEKRAQIAAYETGDRLNCIIMVPDAVETQPPKRALAHADSEAESEPEPETQARKRNKKKKARVVVEQE